MSRLSISSSFLVYCHPRCSLDGNLVKSCFTIYHLPPGFLSLRKEEPLPELFPQTPVPSYSWPRSTQVADKIVSPSCFRSSLPPCPFSWCPLCHSFSPPVVVETCNVSRPSVYSLLDNVLLNLVKSALTNVKVVIFRENASVAILAADRKRSF